MDKAAVCTTYRALRQNLASRIHGVRLDLFGEEGGAILAQALGLPLRTWLSYESGVIIPGEVLLRFIMLTRTRSAWLFTGQGPKYFSQPQELGVTRN